MTSVQLQVYLLLQIFQSCTEEMCLSLSHVLQVATMYYTPALCLRQ